LDVVAILVDVPENHISIGQVGVVVDVLAEGIYEVEFCNKKGETLAMISISSENLLPLFYDERAVAWNYKLNLQFMV